MLVRNLNRQVTAHVLVNTPQGQDYVTIMPGSKVNLAFGSTVSEQEKAKWNLVTDNNMQPSVNEIAESTMEVKANKQVSK